MIIKILKFLFYYSSILIYNILKIFTRVTFFCTQNISILVVNWIFSVYDKLEEFVFNLKKYADIKMNEICLKGDVGVCSIKPLKKHFSSKVFNI